MASKKVTRSPQRRRLASRVGTTTTTVALPYDLHQRLRLVAVKTNWTMTEILRQAATEWLARHQGDVR